MWSAMDPLSAASGRPLDRADHAMWDLSLDMLAVVSPAGRFLAVDATWEKTLGYSWAELSARPFINLVHTEDRLATLTSIDVLLEPSPPLARFECRVVCKDGSVKNLTQDWKASADGSEIYILARDITHLKQAEKERNRAARYSRSLIEASLDPLVTISAEGTIMDVNAATENVTGVIRDTLIGSDFSSYFTEPDQARAGYELVFSQGQVTDYPLAIRHTSGSTTNVLYNATVYTDENGDVAGVFAAARDITDLMRAEAALAAEAQLRLGMDNSPIGMCIVSPEGRFIRVNPTLCGILGRTQAELESLHWRDVTHPDDLDSGLGLVRELQQGRRSSFRTRKRYLTPDGSTVWAEVSVGVLPNEDGSVNEFLAQVVDNTEQVRAEQELLILATHDPLTGLANRAALRDEITRALSSSNRSGQLTAVLMIDLDRFKYVNDSLGHTAGDELLRAAADRIASSVRGGDLVARPGGDEFVIVMRQLDDPSEAVRVAWRIVTDLRAPFKTNGAELSATASIGVAIATASSGAEDLLREADTAMYLAKSEGRDRVTLFNEELRVAASYRLTTEAQLRHALREGQLEVRYQPEVDLRTGSLVAVEALLRWHHPDGLIYNAARFIDIAEETGIILDIGDWVIRSVCDQAAIWQSTRPDRKMTVRFNLSTLQVAEDGLLTAIDDALAASGADPRLLCVEITETALLRETATAHANLLGIHERGISIAVDDFGTGFASLAYLREYPVDALKIDRSFVASINSSDQSRRIVNGIIALSVALGISVTAEGVETEQQASTLREVGCPAAQGFLYSPAVPAADIDAFLDATFPTNHAAGTGR
jgi:diguanylate cyclase (GGDEF)-like protein/PAS domain S-box-containing protein